MKLENLTALRKEKNLSQDDLAKVFDVSQNTVSRWENGEREPDNKTLIGLAEYFGVSIDYLLDKTIVRRPIETTAAHMIDQRGELTPDEESELHEYLQFMRERNRRAKKTQ